MNTKIIATVFVVLLTGGFLMGCITINAPENVYVTPEPEVVYIDIVPDNYYSWISEIPSDMTVMEWLALSYDDPYQEDRWDCSQMSAYVENVLERAGVDAIIFVGDTTGDGEIDHAWVGIWIIEGTYFDDFYYASETGYYWYEATGCYWIDECNWEVHEVFFDLYEIEDWFQENNYDNFEQEFGWWM